MKKINANEAIKQATFIKATVYRTDGTKEEIQIPKKGSLDMLQKIVGGLIEIIYIVPLLDSLRSDFSKGKDLIINEEGKLLDLEPNPFSQLVGLNSIWEAETFYGDIILVEGRLP